MALPYQLLFPYMTLLLIWFILLKNVLSKQADRIVKFVHAFYCLVWLLLATTCTGTCLSLAHPPASTVNLYKNPIDLFVVCCWPRQFFFFIGKRKGALSEAREKIERKKAPASQLDLNLQWWCLAKTKATSGNRLSQCKGTVLGWEPTDYASLHRNRMCRWGGNWIVSEHYVSMIWHNFFQVVVGVVLLGNPTGLSWPNNRDSEIFLQLLPESHVQRRSWSNRWWKRVPKKSASEEWRNSAKASCCTGDAEWKG